MAYVTIIYAMRLPQNKGSSDVNDMLDVELYWFYISIWLEAAFNW